VGLRGRVRLLHVQQLPGITPEAKVAAALIRRREGYDAAVLAHSQDSRETVRRYRELVDAPLHLVCTGYSPYRRWRVRQALTRALFEARLPAMLRRAQRLAPDIVYSAQAKNDVHVALRTARHLGIPYVVHVHYVVGDWLGAETLAALRSADRIVTVSDFIRREVIREGGVAPEKVVRIWNSPPEAAPAADSAPGKIRDELRIPRSHLLVTMVAQMRWGKGFDDAIEAFVRFHRQHPASTLLLVGDGDERAKLEQQARGYDAPIRFAGPRGDVAAILAESDVFIHPSRLDPFPLAVLEATHAGLPVVAYAEGGVQEEVEHGVTGLLAPAKEIDTLAKSLAILAGDPGLRRRMGSAGRDRVARLFDAEVAAHQFENVLYEALAPRLLPGR